MKTPAQEVLSPAARSPRSLHFRERTVGAADVASTWYGAWSVSSSHKSPFAELLFFSLVAISVAACEREARDGADWRGIIQGV